MRICRCKNKNIINKKNQLLRIENLNKKGSLEFVTSLCIRVIICSVSQTLTRSPTAYILTSYYNNIIIIKVGIFIWSINYLIMNYNTIDSAAATVVLRLLLHCVTISAFTLCYHDVTI